MKTYEYYQPEYVKNFQCDGQKCSAHCCKNCNVIIDKKIYKKYSHQKPKSAAKELTRPLKKINEDSYKINLNENSNCPFLTEDNLCSIQKKYGEDFVPQRCLNYPRRTWFFNYFLECSLTLACPVAAEQILLPTEPMKFEKFEVAEDFLKNSARIQIDTTLLSPSFFDKLIPLQETAIKILQERALTIDQRLLILELYFDKLEELLGDEKFDESAKVNSVYSNVEFFKEQVAQISSVLNFDVTNHLTIILEILKTESDKNLFEKIVEALGDTSELISKYISLADERQKFLQKFSTVFENYLVNEFLFNFYPFRFYEGITQNYNCFLITYKLIELVTFSMSLEKEYSAKDLVSAINLCVNSLEDNSDYTKRILEYLKTQKDPVEIMHNMLQL